MLAEKARVVAVEPGAIWVETLAQSACGSCAEKGECGTGLLQRYLHTTRYLRIDIESGKKPRYGVGDELELGLDESVVVRGSLMLYLLPLIGLILGAALGYGLGGELWSVLLGAGGLLATGIGLRWHAEINRFNPAYHPVVMDQSVILSRSSPH